MKMFKNLILILFVFLSGFLSAQNENTTLLEKEIQELSQAYQLDQEQSNSLNRILVKKYEMLKGIEFHKENDFERFLILRRTIYKGTEGSIKLILTEDQIVDYNKEVMRKRKINSERVKALKAQGADKQQLIDAGLGIEW
jgi:hypothetical protein